MKVSSSNFDSEFKCAFLIVAVVDPISIDRADLLDRVKLVLCRLGM